MYSLFFTAFIQTCLVACNVLFITKGYILPMLITGFGISFFWTANVKKIAFSNMKERICYASGACFGTGVGYYLSIYLLLKL